MKEKIFKKGIAKRLYSVILALVMVVSLMPMNSITAYAAETGILFCSIHGSEEHHLRFEEVDPRDPDVYLFTSWINNEWHDSRSLLSNNPYWSTLSPVKGEWFVYNPDKGRWGEYEKCNGTHSIHVHEDHYGVTTTTTANDTLTWYCGKEGCGSSATSTNPVKLTLSASSANYSGSEVEATMDITAWVAANLSVPTIVYEAASGSSLTDGKAVEVGSYTAKITVNGVTATKEFSITGGSTPTPDPSPSSDSKPSEPAKTELEAREIIEESMPIAPVSNDLTQLSKANAELIPGGTYNLSNFITTRGIVKGINAAVAGSNKTGSKTATIYSGRPLCFNGEIIKAINTGKKDVVYFFTYKGHLYSVTIPATVDASKVLEKAGFAGPFYVGQQLGTTVLVK